MEKTSAWDTRNRNLQGKPLFHLTEITSNKAQWGKKFSLRSLNQIVLKLCLGWVIAGDLHVRSYIKLVTQIFVSDSSISNNNTVYLIYWLFGLLSFIFCPLNTQCVIANYNILKGSLKKNAFWIGLFKNYNSNWQVIPEK